MTILLIINFITERKNNFRTYCKFIVHYISLYFSIQILQLTKALLWHIHPGLTMGAYGCKKIHLQSVNATQAWFGFIKNLEIT